MVEKKDIVIIGAGAVGCSIAYHLAKRGITSTIIERESIGARASGKAWAVITYPPILMVSENNPNSFYSFPEGDGFSRFQDLLWSAYYRMSDLAVDIKDKCGVDIEYGEMPWTFLAMSDQEESIYRKLLELLKGSKGQEGEWLDGGTLKRIFPGIQGDIRGGLSLPQIQVEPYKYTLGLAESAEAMGADIRSGDVVGFELERGRITSISYASGKRVDVGSVVIAMGPWSSAAAAQLGCEIPIINAMTECLRIDPKKPFPEHSLLCNLEILSRVNGDIILAGAESAAETDYFRSQARPDFDSSLSEEVKDANIEAAMALLPDLLSESVLAEHRGDLLAYGPKPYCHKPVLGRIPELENGYIATRFGALGIQMSLGAGEVMADLIATGEVPICSRQMMAYLSPEAL